MTVPFVSFTAANQQIRSEIFSAFEKVFDKGWYILGEEVKAFEKEYAEFNKVSHAVAVSNGLDALQIALRTLGVKEKDEVIIPSHTFIATALAISAVGATPVFVEPDIQTYNIDPSLIEEKITTRTKAIIPVHLYGQSCEMDSIMAVADKHGLAVIEDNAQAHLSYWKNKQTGSWGNISATSFYPGKNLGALGDAGLITTNDSSLAAVACMIRNYGSAKKYYHEIPGSNQRMDEMQAAFLRIKLRHLSGWTKQRQAAADLYNSGLQEVGDILSPFVAEHATHVYHLYVVRTSKRDSLQQHLTADGVETLIHYPTPVHLQPAYQHLGYTKGDFPLAETLAETCLSLPMWPGISEEQILRVCESIKTFFTK